MHLSPGDADAPDGNVRGVIGRGDSGLRSARIRSIVVGLSCSEKEGNATRPGGRYTSSWRRSRTGGGVPMVVAWEAGISGATHSERHVRSQHLTPPYALTPDLTPDHSLST